MKKLAIITTHPIQYNAPWFRLLAQRGKLAVKAFYTWGQVEQEEKYDPGFGKNVEWDIPLLEGYDYSFVKNVATDPGSHHYKGIDNPTLVNELEEWGPDAMLVFGWSFKSHLKLLRYFKGKKAILFRGDSNLLDEPKGFSLKKAARRIFLRWIYHHVDTALYVGSANQKYYKKMGMKDNQLVFAPHAVDNERFCNGRDNMRKPFQIPGQDTIFLFSGKLEEKKNPALLLKAFISLNDPHAHLLFVGNGLLEDSLKKLVKENEAAIQQGIHFAGFKNQSEMPGIYQSADILVLPSQGPGETWGLSVNEAMAAGCAVLVSDKCGCHAELVRDGTNGYVFKSNDERQLIKLMKKMLADKNELKKMQEASKRIIAAYSFDHVCKAIEEIMD